MVDYFTDPFFTVVVLGGKGLDVGAVVLAEDLLFKVFPGIEVDRQGNLLNVKGGMKLSCCVNSQQVGNFCIHSA